MDLEVCGNCDKRIECLTSKICLKSKVRCLSCGTILESKYRHDFQKCGCSNETFIDGGLDYCRLGGVDLSKIEVWNREKMKFIPVTGGG